MKNFRNLRVWQDGHQFVLQIYGLTKKFPKEEMYVLTSQLRRAAVSIPTNLAEGCGKKGDKELARYAQISLGSTQEVEYLIFLAFELGYYSLNEFKAMDEMVNRVKAKLINFLDSLGD
jgi:four helix bundle protein